MSNQTEIGRGVPFHRIRRITGYLVGSLERWGNAKRAEERDRVKHDAKEDKYGTAPDRRQ